MIKTRKYLHFQQMKIELSAAHPKEVSRAVMCLRDEEGNVFKTSKYGEVTETSIQWDDSIEILYTNQEVFQIETHCEHEYGYQINELEALYNGQVYIKTENFFRPLTVHIFNASTGEKCGFLRYLIKVVEKEVEKTSRSKPSTVKQEGTVKVDLLAKISLYAASVTFNTPLFKKEKYASNFSFLIEICGQKIEGVYKKNFQWIFDHLKKIQCMEDSPEEVNLLFKQNGQLILAGQTDLATLKQNKRFVTHQISLLDHHNAKIATLTLDLRYVTKQEVLDLMYSPTKLSGPVKKDEKDKGKDLTKSQISKYNQMRSNSSALATSRKQQELHDKSQVSHSVLPDSEGRTMNRYQKVILNNSNEIIFPRAKRFSNQMKVNPHVSYSDPQKISDFYSPRDKAARGYDMSRGKKMDFTKPSKGVPGVGSYKLPSIWDKY